MQESLAVAPHIHLGMSVMQAALTAWKHMVQLAGETTSDESAAAKAAKWTVVATFSSFALLALAENAGVQAQDAGNSRLLQLRVDLQHLLCTKL